MDILALRVDLRARRGEWEGAAADEALAIEIDPQHNASFPVLAALLARTHNRAAYDQFCQKAAHPIRQSGKLFILRTKWRKPAFSATGRRRFAGHRPPGRFAGDRGWGGRSRDAFFEDNKALSEYRQGHFTEAVAWAEKPLKVPGIYIHGHAEAVVAMAEWRLGKKDEARAALAEGNVLDPAVMPATIAEDPSNAPQLAWLYARIQLDEATALVQPRSLDQGSH